jgi:hypothetical protein
MLYVGGCTLPNSDGKSRVEVKAEPYSAFPSGAYPAKLVTLVDHVRLTSKPPGAVVFLIPKVEYERNPGIKDNILKDPLVGARYRVQEGVTPVETTTREMVYIAIFVLSERAFIGEADFRPGQKNEMSVVFP